MPDAATHSPAIEELIGPLLEPGYRLAYLMLHDHESAEDAVQNAALKSWRKVSQLRPGANPLPWFLGFVANECRNSRRSRWRSVIHLGDRDDLVSPTSGPDSDLDVKRALMRLRPRDRLVVLLHFYLDMRFEDIATVTGLRVAGARSRLYRALELLRKDLRMEERE